MSSSASKTSQEPSSATVQVDPKLLVALDFDSQGKCLALVEKLKPEYCRLKIGKEMFTRFGPALVEQVQALGFEVFLDLKFHDIPNTVAKAVAAAADLGVWMVNVHASGGERMLMAAKEAIAQYEKPPKLIAVTVLTSMDESDLAGTGIAEAPAEQALRLARLAKQVGLDGVVCSAQEVAKVKSACGSSFLCITPGIRLKDSAADDQRRIMTPDEAIGNGSDYLVVGRPITKAEEPLVVAEQIHNAVMAASAKEGV